VPAESAPVSEAQRGPIVAVILAAGMSKRLGRPKQLLELNGVPLVRHVATRVNSSTVDRVLVVTGAESSRVRAALAGLGTGFVVNPAYESGQASSLRAGLAALPGDADAMVVLLADQPGIDPVTIDRVVAARRERGAGIVMAQYGEDRGHPVLFGREFFDELARIEGDQGGREVIRAHAGALVLVAATTDLVPDDVDTEEAWIRLQERWREEQS
jgi:molybdenum cofactor cytidylyltransferase